jgi:HD-GYP domain-containing protein (c-di-GMP phosphodiesterase class II)
MHIEGEVYFKFEKSFIMLCKDVTITPALLNKFYQTEWGNQELYVEKKHVKGILELSKQFRQRSIDRGETMPVFEKPAESTDALPNISELTAKINLQEDYNDIKERLSSVMENVATEGKISLEAPEAIAVDVSEKIELTDPALLIDCINNLRDPDDYLNAHAANVAMLNGLIGTWLNLPRDDVDALIKTGLLHDVGKLRIPIEILNKPSALTKEEFDEMKKHPIYSYEILKMSGETDARILEGALSHHERLTGSGYPSGLKVTQISLSARITAVSDVYDAMVAKHAYRSSRSPFVILDEFTLHKFSDLDIGIVNVFLDKMPSVLVGKSVLLSDGRTAQVTYVNPHNFKYPLVEIDGECISTSPALECISLDNFLAKVED